MISEKFKIKYIIKTSPNIPKIHKRKALEAMAIAESIKATFKDLSLVKSAFAHITYHDSYDLFTSSILCCHYKNGQSLDILNRAQVETFMFTEYLLIHPELLQNIFDKEMWCKDVIKEIKSKSSNPMVKPICDFYFKFWSKKTHPLPTRFLSNIGTVTFYAPENDVEFSKLFIKYVKKPNAKLEEALLKHMKPIGISQSFFTETHTIKNEKAWEDKFFYSILLFVFIFYNLIKLQECAPNTKLDDSVSWKDIIKPYKKD
jgi:hypothetical protein